MGDSCRFAPSRRPSPSHSKCLTLIGWAVDPVPAQLPSVVTTNHEISRDTAYNGRSTTTSTPIHFFVSSSLTIPHIFQPQLSSQSILQNSTSTHEDYIYFLNSKARKKSKCRPIFWVLASLVLAPGSRERRRAYRMKRRDAGHAGILRSSIGGKYQSVPPSLSPFPPPVQAIVKTLRPRSPSPRVKKGVTS